MDVVISNCVINLSTDKPRVLAEAFRVLRPGGRLGVSDVIADEGTDPAQLADAEQRVGCLNGALTQARIPRTCCRPPGSPSITITLTHEAEPGLALRDHPGGQTSWLSTAQWLLAARYGLLRGVAAGSV